MTSIQNTRIFGRDTYFGPRIPPRKRSILPETDHQKLQQHLGLCEGLRQPSWTLLAYVLHNKILTTEPIASLYARDLVTGGCHVTYSVNGGPRQTGLLVHRARSGSSSGVIPVASLLGATLIGMRVGQRAPLLSEDGAIMSVSILNVTPPN
jgi:hypothetical protein